MFIKATELYPGADIALSGARFDAREWRYFGPRFDAFTNEGMTFMFECSKAGNPNAPFAPACVLREVDSEHKQKERGAPCTDPDAVARRVEAARQELPKIGALPAAGLSFEMDARLPLIDSLAARLIEAYALPVDVSVSLMCELAPGLTGPIATMRAREVAERLYAIWTWDEAGQRADERMRADQAAREKANAEAAAAKAFDARLNTKTCRELGIVVAWRKPKSRPNALTSGPFAHSRDGRLLYVYSATELFGRGVAVPDGDFEDVVGGVFPPDYVIGLTNGEVRSAPRIEIGAKVEALINWRRGRGDDSAITEFRTLKDADGKWLVDQIEELFKPFVAVAAVGRPGGISQYSTACVLGGGALFNFMVHAYARSGIRKDVAWDSYREVVTRAFHDTCEGGPEIVTPARTVWLDVLGREHDAPHTYDGEHIPGMSMMAGDLTMSRKVARDEFGEAMTPKTYPEKRVPRPLPGEVGLDAFSRVYDQAIAGGPCVLFGKDELLEAKPVNPSFARSWLDRILPDPWFKALQRMAKSSQFVTTADIETELRATGLVSGPMSSEDHARVTRAMQRYGFVKDQVQAEDGKRRRGFVRAKEGTP